MLISAEHLSINFGSRQLLQDVDFYLNEGDKTGVIGINGTGKSTFLKVLAGLVQPDSGRISRRPNLQVSYLPQNPEMDDDRTILEQVFASMPPQFRALNEYEAKAMLTKLGLGETDRRIGTLSGGERRRAPCAQRSSTRRTCWCSTSRRTTLTRRWSPGWRTGCGGIRAGSSW